MSGNAREAVAHDEQTRILAIVAGLILAVLTWAWVSVQAASIMACGSGVRPTSLLGMFGAFDSERSTVSGWHATSSGCFPSPGTVWIAAGIVFALGMVLTVVAVLRWRAYKQSARWLLRDVARREGIAQSPEVNRMLGPKAYSRARRAELRPTLSHVRIEDASIPLGISQQVPVRISVEDSVLVYGPPRSGKGLFIAINTILNAPGAVISSSTRPDNMALTRETRAQVGPIAVFDPTGLAGPVTEAKKWSPIAGYQDPEVANRRAGYIMSAAPLGQSGSNAEWAQKAQVILSRLLHAAALGDLGVDTLYAWTTSPGNAHAAVSVLKEHPRAEPFWAESLESQLSSDPKMLSSLWFGVSAAGAGLDTRAVRAWMMPRTDTERLDVAEFIRNKGTLYLLGDQSASASISPWLIALLNDFYDTAQELAASGPTAPRLDPPLTMVLDEAANVISKWEKVPSIMSAGGGSGIVGVFFFQSPSQIRANWGDKQAEVVFDNATCKIQLGGSALAKDLKELSDLMGERRIDTRSETRNEGWRASRTLSTERASVLTVDEMRRIPFGHALVFYKSARPMLVKLRRWSERRDADALRASAKQFAAQQRQAGMAHAANAPDVDEVGLDTATSTQGW